MTECDKGEVGLKNAILRVTYFFDGPYFIYIYGELIH